MLSNVKHVISTMYKNIFIVKANCIQFNNTNYLSIAWQILHNQKNTLIIAADGV